MANNLNVFTFVQNSPQCDILRSNLETHIHSVTLSHSHTHRQSQRESVTQNIRHNPVTTGWEESLQRTPIKKHLKINLIVFVSRTQLYKHTYTHKRPPPPRVYPFGIVCVSTQTNTQIHTLVLRHHNPCVTKYKPRTLALVLVLDNINIQFNNENLSEWLRKQSKKVGTYTQTQPNAHHPHTNTCTDNSEVDLFLRCSERTTNC